MLRRDTYNDLCQQMGSPNFLPLITPELLSDLSRELLDLGAKIVCLKLGDRGLYLRTSDQATIESLGRAYPADPAAWANQEIWTPCFKVDLVGTTGSGDATIAGFLSALLRNFSPADAVTAAVAVGACNIEALDALGGIRPWDETMKRVADGWQKYELVLESPGWRFDEERRLWVGEKDSSYEDV
jgi:sugar/nucleoside kinase (ribokinase family)